MKISLPNYFNTNVKPKYLIYNADESQYLHRKYFHNYFEFLTLDGHHLTQHTYDAHDILSSLINISTPHFLFTKAQAEYCMRCFRSIVGTHALELLPLADFKRACANTRAYIVLSYDYGLIHHTGLYSCLVNPLHQPFHFKTLNREDVIYSKDTYSGKQLKLLKHLLSTIHLNYAVVDYDAFRTAYQND